MTNSFYSVTSLMWNPSGLRQLKCGLAPLKAPRNVPKCVQSCFFIYATPSKGADFRHRFSGGSN